MPKRVRRILPFLLSLLLLPYASALADSDDEKAVRTALGNYLRGHETGVGEHHSKVFHPTSSLYWVRDGALNERPSEQYIAGASGKPADDESERQRRIVMVDVTGDAAVAKIELDYPGAFITDYMSLLKVDGEWRIIAKIFTVERRAED